MTARPIYCERFINRREQCKLLRSRLEEALIGRGSLVLVSGEAGIGKTRFINEFYKSAADQDLFCSTGHCLEYARPPFGAFRSLLRSLFEQHPAALKTEPQLAATAAIFVPELRVPDMDGVPQELDKLGQFDALRRILRSFARVKPLLLTIEDLHWSDVDSLQLLQHLVPDIGTLRLMLMTTYRTDELRRDHPLASLLARLGRYQHVWQCPLPPFTDGDMIAMVSAAVPAGDRPSAAVLDGVRRLAEGVPLTAEELLKSALDHAKEAGSTLDIPPSVSEAVLQRLRQFDSQERSIIAHAAALGRRFEPQFLATATDRPLEEIIAALKKAMDLQLIVEDSNGAVRYAFRHALTREAIYGELLAVEASGLHARIAATLEAKQADNPPLVELAYHYWKARDWDKATHYNELAGDAAMSLYAYNEALENYERALAHPHLTQTKEVTLRIKLGDGCYAAGFGNLARGAYERALQLGEAAPTEQSAIACLALVQVCWDSGDVDAAFRNAEHALAITGHSANNATRFGAHVIFARLLAMRGEPRRALAELKQAEPLLGESRRNDVFSFYWARATAFAELARAQDAIEEFRRAVSRALQEGDVRNLLSSYHIFGATLTLLGRKSEALACFETARKVAYDNRVGGTVRAGLLGAYAWSAQQFGLLQPARDLLEEALLLSIDERRFRISALAAIGISLGLRLQDHELVRRCADSALIEEAFSSGKDLIFQAALAFVELYTSRGELNAAEALLQRVVALQAPAFQDDVEVFVKVAQFGRLDDIPAARRLLERSVNISQRAMESGQLALFDAYAAQRMGDMETTKAAAIKAAAFFHGLEWPLHQARAYELLGRVEDARGLYLVSGDKLGVQRLEKHKPPISRRGRANDELTAREVEVAGLVAAGKSNRDIAAQLAISERTVENHVASIYQKLDVKTRVELSLRLKGVEQSAKR